MNTVEFIERHIISALVNAGFDRGIAQRSAYQAVDYYRRSGSASGRGKKFDDCLNIAKAWAHRYQPGRK